MASTEDVHTNHQSVYPDIGPVDPELERASVSQPPQYSVNPSSEASPSGSEILSGNDAEDEEAYESPRRKRRRLFEAAISDYDDPDFTLSGDNESPS